MNPSPRLDMLRHVDVLLSVELGRTFMKLKDVLALGPDTVVPLGRQVDEPLDVFVNGRRIAEAEVITEGDRFALRIVSLCDGDESHGAAAHADQAQG